MRRNNILKFGDVLKTELSTYQVLQFLGSGGSSETYLVVTTEGFHAGTPYAARLFYCLDRDERRITFLQETEFLKTTNHPGILRIIDSEIYMNKYPFMIAEYWGKTLRDVIKSADVNITIKLFYAVQIISALVFLSQQVPPVVHRDIKPENIFIKELSCVLGDFGLAKKLTTDMHEDDRSLPLKLSAGPGMPIKYRTPDLVDYANNIHPLTIATDVFQAGLVLAELFTGRNPEKRVSRNRILSPVELNNIDPIAGDFGAPITNLLEGMLKIDPAERQSADSLLPAWLSLLIEAAKRKVRLDGWVI